MLTADTLDVAMFGVAPFPCPLGLNMSAEFLKEWKESPFPDLHHAGKYKICSNLTLSAVGEKTVAANLQKTEKMKMLKKLKETKP